MVLLNLAEIIPYKRGNSIGLLQCIYLAIFRCLESRSLEEVLSEYNNIEGDLSSRIVYRVLPIYEGLNYTSSRIGLSG